MQLLKSAGILLLVIGASLSIMGYVLSILDMDDMFLGTLTGPIINIVALAILLFYFAFKKENTHESA